METMHSNTFAYVMLIWAALSQLLGGAAVDASLIAMAVPPSSWDKGCPDKHHRFSGECIVSLI